MTDEELKSAVAAAEVNLLGNVATVQLANTTPPDWKVAVVAAGINFYYEDGSSETVQPKPFVLYGGQSYSFHSTKPQGCVKRAKLIITVHADGTADSPSYELEWTDVPANSCMNNRSAVYGPKQSNTVLGLQAIGLAAVLDRPV